MPHAFKLAHRLSRYRSLILLSLASLAACSAADSPITDPGTTQEFARSRRIVSVTPSAISEPVGQVIQLTAVVTSGYGQVMAGALVTWMSSDTTVVTVNASGLASTVRAGSAAITATSAGARGTAAITVTPASGTPGTVNDLAVTGATDSSVTLSFTEVANGAGGPATYQVRYAPASISWGSATSVASGTCATPIAGAVVGALRSCTVTGLAASTTYQFQMVAFRGTMNLNATYGGLSDVAKGVTLAGGTGAPSPGDTTYPHQPAGFITIADRAFNALTEAGWLPNSDAGNYFSIVQDPTAPRSAPNVGQALYPAGWSYGGNDPIYLERDIGSLGYTQIYMTFWVKLSANWVPHPSSVNKIGYAWIHGCPCVYTSFHGGTFPLHSQVDLQGVPNGALDLTANINDVPLSANVWYRWDVILESNTSGNADGVAHWWINGVEAGYYTNLTFGLSSQTNYWESASWEPVYGGVSSGTLASAQEMWMDHWYISGHP